MIVVTLIYCFLLPPLAAFLQVGLTTHFWISIIFTILGCIPAIIHALRLVLSEQRG